MTDSTADEESAAGATPAARGARGLIFTLFAISGFSGLIYESVWTHYLKLLLGHAAFAQTLVLVIFMGGMALGSWWAASRTVRWRNLLLGYAVVEGLVGLGGVVFHQVFEAGIALTFDTVLPALADPNLGNLFRWSFAAALVLPQSVLLGMSFPLMSSALVRRFPAQAGHSLATLYFTNSLGAAVGVLASGFVLIEALGLPGTVLTAGLVNCALAVFVWLMARREGWSAPPVATATAQAAGGSADATEFGRPWLLLGVAFATGMASFMYEIGWIRMLSLVLGASTHAFELMLSAFITGLALGSLWVRGRIQNLRSPLRFLGLVQVVMGLAALGTLVAYGSTFELMAAVMQGLVRNAAGYTLFNLSSHAIAMLVMIPVTFCAGMTLPLITHGLIRGGFGERSIGHVYAANTVGAIAGVLVAVHVLMPLLGLKALIVGGAAIDIALGTVLLRRAGSRLVTGAALVGTGALIAVVLLVQLDVHRMVSGVFRYGRLDLVDNVEVRYHGDGKTATVNVIGYPNGIVGLLTNGKTDASMQLQPGGQVSTDELTMSLASGMALAAHPEARRAAVVGFGAGKSTHILLGSRHMERVDTIEIEPKMYEAARVFHPLVARAYDDPRSHLHFDDARAFFSSRQRRYDLIISEPSNPWVSGIATLFTEEFYAHTRRHLNADGLFVQWIHGFEISMPLVASVVTALGNVYDDYALYNLNGRDLLFIAGARDRVYIDAQALLQMPDLRADLTRVGVTTPRDLEVRYLGGRGTLEPLFASYASPPNSDYFPILDLGAVRARFMQEDASGLFQLRRLSLPLVDMLEPERSDRREARLTDMALFTQAQRTLAADAFVASLDQAGELPTGTLPDWMAALRVEGTLLWPTCGREPFRAAWHRAADRVNHRIAALVSKDDSERLLAWMAPAGCAGQYRRLQTLKLDLIRAIGARDGATLARAAEAALNLASVTDPNTGRYLLAASMLGYINAGRSAQAVRLFEQHGGALGQEDPSLAMRVLSNLAATRALLESLRGTTRGGG